MPHAATDKLDESVGYTIIGSTNALAKDNFSWLSDETSSATYDYVRQAPLYFAKLKIYSAVVTKCKNLTKIFISHI